MPENFEIAHMWVLWLLPLPVLLYFVVPAFRLRSSSLRFPLFGKTEVYTGMKARKSALVRHRNLFFWLGLFVVWILLLAAAASPQLVGKPEMEVKTSRNFLIVADISFSMATNDWIMDGKRVRRWDAVQSLMKDFIDKREGDRMGLIFFGSSAYIQAPFTPDLKTVGSLLEETDVGMAGQMTNIGKAIVKGIGMFDRDTISHKVMLVLTDGVDSGTDILPLDAADLAQKDTIVIHTLGIGTPGSGGSDLDEETLKEISEMTEGKYFRGNDAEQLAAVYEELDKIEPIEYQERTFRPRTLLFWYPLAAALGLCILLMLLSISLAFVKKYRANT